ncbi:MAG TPA: PAS domain S-box protein [Bacteroidales bacterium]|nr:PAS domain S-box protein [Bacteroidales bacterium]
MNDHYKILIVEDNPLDAELARREIRQVLKSVEFVELCTEDKFLESLDIFKPDIIVSDFSMPNFDGMSVIRLAKKHASLIPVIIFTGSLNEETAAETVKAGAVDYVLKENNIRLRQAIQYALEKKQMWKERLEAEEKLRNSEERYRALFELAADGILKISAEGKLIDINHSGLQLAGYHKAEVLQMPISEFFSKEELEKHPIRYDLLQKGQSIKIERTFVRKDRSTCIVEMHSKMMPDKTIQSIFRDITERKNTERDLRESEERLSLLIQSLPVGVVIHHKGRVVFANKATMKIMEVPPDMDFEGHEVLDFIAPEYHQMARKRIDASLKGNQQSEQAEEVFITYAGKRIITDVMSIPILFKGEMSVLSVFSDITARKQAETLLKESETKYRSFFENTGTAIAISEEDTTLSLVNEKYAELAGLPKEEIENKKSFKDFMVPEDIENSMRIHFLRLKEPQKAEKCYELGFKNIRGEVRNMLVYTDIIPGTNKSLASLLDITDRKLAEEEVKKSRMLLRTMIDSLPLWIVALDINGNVSIANNYFTETFKTSLDRIEGHKVKDFFFSEKYEQHKGWVDMCRKTGKPVHFNDEFEFEKGKTTSVYGSYVPLYDPSGDLFGVTAVGIDISKQKQTENLLRESETRFRSTFEGAPIGMSLNFIDGKFFEANNAFCQMIGYSKEELRSHNFLDNTHPDDLELSKQFIKDIQQLEGNNPKSIEKRYLKKDGSLIWVITSVSLYRDVNNNPKYFIVQVLDITEQKLTEQKLVETKNQLEVIFNNGPDAILLTRIENGHYVDSNKTFTRYTGYTPDDLIGKSTLDIDIWGNPDDRNRLIKEVKEKGFCHNFELEIKNKDRTSRIIEMSAEVILIKGVPHLLTISRDIAERKKMEELLKKQNEELHELVSTKDRFFSIIAHDLKDPHNAILGFSEILSGSYDILSDQDRKNYIGNILHSSQNLARLLRNLLEWANSQTGRLIYKPENINIAAVVQETMDILVYQAKIKQIRLIPDINASQEVFADPNMVRTILRNLVSNAIKYTHRNGFVKINTSPVTNRNRKPDFLEISVSDNGIGIKKENLNNLFKLDHKVKTPGTEEEMGSGLGLILCYELVRKNNGYLNINSEENVGTTVTFALPKK